MDISDSEKELELAFVDPQPPNPHPLLRGILRNLSVMKHAIAPGFGMVGIPETAMDEDQCFETRRSGIGGNRLQV